jgi:hypothetical protein
MLAESAALVCHFILGCFLGGMHALCFRQSISMTRKAARINPNGNLFPPSLSTGSSHVYLGAACLPLNVVENQTTVGRLCWLAVGNATGHSWRTSVVPLTSACSTCQREKV